MTIELGCGLISIGRKWGAAQSAVPTETEAIDFLQYAVERGIRFFDTAPAYGSSEERLGKFIKAYKPNIFIATKCGEIYNPDGTTTVSHKPSDLRRSIENSLSHLGKINLLQLHKASISVLNEDVLNILHEYAEIEYLGVSVSDIDTAHYAGTLGMFEYMQFPYNQANTKLEQVFEVAKKQDMYCIINRPLNEGKLLGEKTMQDAYAFIKQQDFKGIALTGTKNKKHLDENIAAWRTS